MDSETTGAESAGAPDLAEVRFAAPLLGLEHLSRFALVEIDPESPLMALQSLEDEAVRLFVLDPAEVVTGYSPVFDGVSRAAVGLAPGEPGLLLVVVSPGASLVDSTVNLLAPILVNGTSGVAAQVVLAGSSYPLRQPLAA
ncbi:flagellar assembly protein FliW [Quadrisphaera oryzae]|uniref:flagellar assembly protein FliW n=1 Tax=Quadrisphaera TaxID=317661 RepID=UPI0016488E9F|nr:flagellar assembly protein FliW [Quadrisphaera sp. RL12-1S]MBC3763793.1 flagellar assembly protein FliW [Quadrisphaera sp. RL12-1S]